MSVFGVDFLNGEDLEFILVEASSEEEAKQMAGKHLNTLGLPKRNIVTIERYDWLEK